MEIKHAVSTFSNAQCTWTDFLSYGAPRKSQSEDLIFYRSESAHTDRLLIADK